MFSVQTGPRMQPLFREVEIADFMVDQTKTSGTGSGKSRVLDQGGKPWPRGPTQLTACSYKSFIGAQPCPLVFVLSMATLVLP